MRRILLLAAIAFSAGCSNAPVAGFLDCVKSGKSADAGREPVVPRIRPPGSETLPPPAGVEVLPPITPKN